jgi:hypothetical protein
LRQAGRRANLELCASIQVQCRLTVLCSVIRPNAKPENIVCKAKYYKETFCTNPWSSIINIGVDTPKDEKIKAVEEYFKDKAVKIFKIEIVEDGKREACDACHCKTGYRIKCKIKEKDLSKMEKEGFYQ